MKIKVLAKQFNSSDCVVCGTKNNLSLKANYYDLENDLVVGVFYPKDEHQSYPDRLHGGMISAVLDESIGRAIQYGYKNVWGVTAELNVKFRKPVPLNKPLICVGKIIKNSPLFFTGAGFIEDLDGNLLASATAKYVKLPPEKISNEAISPENWYLNTTDDDPEYITINNLDFFDKLN